MGNCLQSSEDHTNLLPITSTATSGLHSNSNPTNISIPKLVTISRLSNNVSITTDINTIKAVQCRNLIERLPLINYDEKTVKQTDCAICLLDFISNEQVRQLPCDGAHVFHPICIQDWLKKSLTCPHCSTNVDAALLLKFIPNSNTNDD